MKVNLSEEEVLFLLYVLDKEENYMKKKLNLFSGDDNEDIFMQLNFKELFEMIKNISEKLGERK